MQKVAQNIMEHLEHVTEEIIQQDNVQDARG